MGDELKFKNQFSCLLSGPSGSGKTSFCIRFLQNQKTLCTVADFNGMVVWCSSELSAIPYRQLAGTKHVRFHEGVPADFNNSGEKPCLVILDDFLNTAY
jgi:septin family protein